MRKIHESMAMLLLTGAALTACSTSQSHYDDQFISYPTYNGDDLELTVTPEATRFRLWSPKAEAVRLNLYTEGTGGKPFKTVEMTADASNGTWTAELPEALYGKFYTFEVKHEGQWLAETPGVWAKAVGLNGERAAIIDLAKTNPEGWESDRGPEVKNFNDVIVYELHMRDMTMHPSAGASHQGKFLGIAESGTKNSSGEATGIDHLKELGITHVHILPSYDYNSVDESKPELNKYNWGYDPLNYNAPEGSYSTDAANPETRIREMKQMVKSLHDAGIGVVMDVVYNHTATTDDSNFELTAPGYYHRHRDDGSYSDASACGNETASDRQQMRDYIINSVKYWADEYHIDGFRFDLMAIHDTETMTQVAAELKKIRPDIFLYGEGWTAGDSPLAPERRALKENVAKMEGIAVFSDDIRDAIKGHYSNEEAPGFVQGAAGQEETVKIGIVGATNHPQVDFSKGNNSKFAYAASPLQVVNYVSCHDDLTLTDKLRKSMPDATDDERKRAARLAQTIVFTSQGTPFMFAGEEIWRDKKGVHNSFESPDSINAIDWNLKSDNRDQFDYYRQLIKLRKEHPAFRMTSAEQVARHLKFDPIDPEKTPNLISYTLIDNANGDSWNEIKVIFNGADEERTIKIPAGDWKIVAADGKLASDGGLGTSKGGDVSVARRSALILAR